MFLFMMDPWLAWIAIAICVLLSAAVPFVWLGLRGSVLQAVRARCVCWADFVDLPTHWTVECMCFHAVKDITIAHAALCPLTVSPMSLSWLPAGITVTYTRSNGDRVPATVISASECGQYVSIE